MAVMGDPGVDPPATLGTVSDDSPAVWAVGLGHRAQGIFERLEGEVSRQRTHNGPKLKFCVQIGLDMLREFHGRRQIGLGIFWGRVIQK